MSPPPADAPIPVEPKRPAALTAICVIGIIFGAMGVLCVCFGLVGALMNGQQQQMMMHASMTQMMLQIATSVFGIVVSTFLLIACIGAMSLRPWSAMMMVVVNVINLILETFKFVVGVTRMNPEANGDDDPDS